MAKSVCAVMLVSLVMTIVVHVVHANWVEYPMKARDMVFQRKLKGHNHVAGTDASGDGGASPNGGTTFFEVGQPVEMPANSKRLCTSTILSKYSFGNTGESPPATSQFTNCTAATYNKVVLRWEGKCSSRQFARIATVWMGGVEILRTCTPEFGDGGGSWDVTKDVTRFTAILKKPRKVSVELGNVIDADNYNGIYSISIFLDFYNTGLKRQFYSPDPTAAPAQEIKAIALANPKFGGYWYRLGGDNPQSIAMQVTGLPVNAYRAVLEVCVSFHGDDESWYTNPPNDYAAANNFTFGNGPFREISVSIDNMFVGAIWPFPLVYSGGFNPLAWRPALPIGVSVLPSYDLDLTPFLSFLSDGKGHTFNLTVLDSLSVWLIDANLHFWIDKQATTTSSSLVSYQVPWYSPSETSKFSGLNGVFVVSAARGYSFSGWVSSSRGNLTTCVTSAHTYNNTLVMEDSFGYQTANLIITSKTQVLTTNKTLITSTYKKGTEYPFSIQCSQGNGPGNSTYLNCTIAHAMSSDETAIFPKGTFARYLNNTQNAEGELTVAYDNTVSGGTGSLQQEYEYKSTTGCYKRDLTTENNAILQDSTSTVCTPCSS